MNAGNLVLGLLNGLSIGLLAIGIVLVYRSNRFLNLAHGQMGALSATLLAKLVVDEGLSWWEAFAICVPIGIIVALVIDRWVIRPLRERSTSAVSLLLVTIGVSQILEGLSSLGAFSPNTDKIAAVGYPAPFSTTVSIGGVVLTSSDLCIGVAVPVLAILLAGFLRYSLLGKTIRAAASNPEEARLCGVSTRRVSAVTWAIAGGLSALSAILQAPSDPQALTSSLGPELLLLALGAAAIAAFSSFPLALAGGLLIGLTQQFTLAETSNGSDGEIAVFILILAIILVRGRAIGHVFAAAGAAVTERPLLRVPEKIRGLVTVRYAAPLGVLAAAGFAALLPLLPILHSESRRLDLAEITAFTLVAISLTVAIGWAGQISLGQFAIVGSGAFIASHMLVHGWSVLFTILPVGLAGAAIMVAVGLPALRVPGLTLAVSTLGLGIIGPDWLFHQSWFGSSQSGQLINPPNIARGLGHPASYLVVYYIGAVLVFGVGLGMLSLRRSQAGRLIVAVRDNETAASSFGVTPATVKTAALALSGFIAGSAGVIWADSTRDVTASQFPIELSFALLAIPVLGGIGSIPGAVGAAALFYTLTDVVTPHLGTLFGPLGGSLGFQLMLSGIGLVLAIRFSPQGLAGSVAQAWQRRLDRLAAEPATVSVPTGPVPLRVNRVSLSFGGLRALDAASIDVAPGEIVGLIGPNGAGKTTLLNVVSGILQADEGTVRLGDVDLTGLPPELRSAMGCARSFQDARLFPGLTVLETLQVAMANQYKSTMVAAAAGAPWVRQAEGDSRERALHVIERLGLTEWADSLISDLSTGTRRICDLAAQAVTRPKVLLLDEPTGGVAQREAEAFGPLLRRIREELDCSILIIEHDMPLLMGLCDRVYAMAAGAVIASGTPEQVRANPEVIASYLGTDDVAVARSGRRAGVPRPAPEGTTRAARSAARAKPAPRRRSEASS